MNVAVITCSNRSANGERADDSGELLAGMLAEDGHEVLFRRIVPDDVDAIRGAVGDALAVGADAIITNGGTGLTPTDVTPEAVKPLLHKEIPGIAEAIRLASRERVPTSVLSRGVAGSIGSALVVTLPGSPGGVRDGMAVLTPLLAHVVDQLRGGDHRSGGWGHLMSAGAEARIAHISDLPLDVAALEAAVDHAGAGARVLFRGVVRDHDRGRCVVRLEYQAHPTAEQVLADVVAEFAAIDGVLAVAASHRVGTLEVGDDALVVAVSCAHRREAFDVCARLVDEIKHKLPVWKRQVLDDGTDEWVNCP